MVSEEIAVVGKDANDLSNKVLSEYIPHKIFMSSDMGNENLPLLAGKLSKDRTLIYLCKDYSCLKPVSGVKDLLKLINNQEQKLTDNAITIHNKTLEILPRKTTFILKK